MNPVRDHLPPYLPGSKTPNVKPNRCVRVNRPLGSSASKDLRSSASNDDERTPSTRAGRIDVKRMKPTIESHVHTAAYADSCSAMRKPAAWNSASGPPQRSVFGSPSTPSVHSLTTRTNTRFQGSGPRHTG